jgi:hypothetical protein
LFANSMMAIPGLLRNLSTQPGNQGRVQGTMRQQET